jgi:hypothetical protein
MPDRPPGAGTGRAGRWHRPRRWRLLLVPVAALALVVAAACDAGSAGSQPARQGSSATCRLSPSMMVASWPDLISMFRDAPAQLPGSQGTAGHPRWDLTHYVCGQYDGFVASDIMYGKYRAEDNALARSLGYQIGKWPLLPVVGQVVSALPHGLLEAYEEAFQFRTAAAAAAWLADARWEPVPPENMTGVFLAVTARHREAERPGVPRDVPCQALSGTRRMRAFGKSPHVQIGTPRTEH